MRSQAWLISLFVFAAACQRDVVELAAIVVTPTTATVARGETLQFVATASYTDGSIKDVTALGAWSVDDAVVGGAMSTPGLVQGLVEGSTRVRFRFQERTLTRGLTVQPANLRTLQLEPAHVLLAVGIGVQTTLIGVDGAGAKHDLTQEAEWSTASPAIATVAHGMVRGAQTGATTLTVSARGLRLEVPVDVSGARLVQLDVQPQALTVPLGVASQLTATALLTDGARYDVTTQVAWSSSDDTVFFPSQLDTEAGLFAALREGSAVAAATLLGVRGETRVTVVPSPLVSLELSPRLGSLAAGTQQRLSLTGVYGDGTRADLTRQAAWASSNAQVATVDVGQVSALRPGAATLSASTQGLTAAVELTVTAATLQQLELQPDHLQVARGLTAPVTATGVFSDGSRQDVTAQAVWASADGTIASVANAAGTSGQVTGLAMGATTVSATLNGVSASAAVTVNAAQLVSLALSPAQPALALGTHQAFTATGLLSDGTTQDVTSQVTWSSSGAQVTIDAHSGVALAAQVGTATVHAQLGAIVGSAEVTVTAATLTSLELSPASADVPLGLTRAFTATGVYTDGSHQTLTTQVTWTSSAPGVLAVSNASGQQGAAVGLSLGTATLTAQLGSVQQSATVRVTSAVVTSLELTASSLSVPVGLTAQLTATATWSDGSTTDVTTQSSFASSAGAVASVSNASGSQGRVRGLSLGTARLDATFQTVSAQVTVTVSQAVLVSLSTNVASLTLPAGTSAPLTAQATFSDGSTADVTAQASWSSSQPALAAVSPLGVVSALAPGSATVRAQLSGQQASVEVTVSSATLQSLEVTPAAPSVPLGATRGLLATGHYSDGSVLDLTSQATWSSSAPAVAAVSNTAPTAGVVSALALGSATVSATFSGHSGAATVTVTPAVLSRVELTPAAPRIAKLTRLRLTATGVWTDGATQALTEACTWSSANPALATVSNAAGLRGRVSALAAGVVDISATCSGVTGTVAFTVTNANLSSIQLSPAAPTAPAGFGVTLSATGVFDDATTQPFTDFVSWSSADVSRATVSNAAGSEGQVQALAQGAVVLSATALNVTGSVTFTVTAALLTGLEVTPASTTVPVGLWAPLTALGHFSDGTQAPVTSTAAWSSADVALATVSNASGSQGRVTGVAQGSVTVTATHSGFSATAQVSITPAVLVALEVTPATPSRAKGQPVQFHASGTFSDGSVLDLTDAVTWTTADGAIAQVSNAAGSHGLGATLAVGSTQVTASSGAISGATTLTVTAAQLVSLGVTPANATLPRGLDLALHATGVYTDGSTQDLTATATWSSTDATLAPVSNAAGSEGRVHASELGSVTVSATVGAVSGSTSLTVTAAVLQQVQLTPPAPSTPAGLSIPLQATGLYSDGSTQDLTATASWSSDDGSIATATQGQVTGVRVGSVTVRATSAGVTGAVQVQVTAALLTALQVTPANVTVPRGLTQQFTATGVFTDGSTQVMTDAVTWSSTDATIASVSNASGTRGLAATPNVGSVTVSATASGITGSTPFTVSPAQLVSVALSPGNGSASLGSTRQYVLTGTYTDGSTQNLTASTTWASSNVAVATVSNAADSAGLATTLATGFTTISGTVQGFTASANLVVVQMTLVRIDLTPDGGSTALGYSRQLIAIGTYSDGTTQVLTGVATWSSSDSSIAFVSNASGSRGLLSTVSTGVVTVSATYQGVTGSTSHTVSPAVLVFLSLSPSPLTLTGSQSASVTATGVFSDGSTQDLTGSVTWLSTDPGVAQVSNASGTRGRVTGIFPGNTTVSASQGSVSASLSVAVN